ncbi:MAG: formylglycine-generating enzyme family protein [Planctomycetota bacterium]|nr:formylglycine-generating enzyme family protein [Planctomycetota bacterium]
MSAFAAETAAPTWPLWDGQESVERYAQRTNLPPTKTLDLGNGVNLELVLIPAGKFIMGTPEPKPVDKVGFKNKILVGQSVFALGVGVLLVLIGAVVVRAIRQRHRPQYSLAMFMVMIVAASVGVMGGMHWWNSRRMLARALEQHATVMGRYTQANDREKPAHEVTMMMPFYMGKYEVTQEQYVQVMGANPSSFKGANLPVEMVSWNGAQDFCKKAVTRPAGSSLDPEDRVTVRLPTEAGWEYACRAGTTTTYSSGDAEADLGRAAWYSANSKGTTHPVGHKIPNAWGVFDMHGNVWEWCENWYEEYKPSTVVDPQGPPDGQYRVVRGACWAADSWYCRSSHRDRFDPGGHIGLIGFRVVVERQR